MDHFNLTQDRMNQNGVLTQVVKGAVIRDVTEGIVPDRQNIAGRIPFNLMKSEKLVWMMQGVDYLEVVTRRERRGRSHGLSIRVARGVYYRPGTFRSRSVEWEETIHQDTGLLGFTTKHIYFSGAKKRFRVRYDRVVDFEPFDDGFGLMRDAQTAKPQSFRTGDGWFAYNWRSISRRCSGIPSLGTNTKMRVNPGLSLSFYETAEPGCNGKMNEHVQLRLHWRGYLQLRRIGRRAIAL